jgi:transposase
VVRVPSPEEEDARQLNRELRSLKKEKTRTTNRIKGLLASQGVRLKPGTELSDKKLDSIRLWDGSPLLPGLKSRVRPASIPRSGMVSAPGPPETRLRAGC